MRSVRLLFFCVFLLQELLMSQMYNAPDWSRGQMYGGGAEYTRNAPSDAPAHVPLDMPPAYVIDVSSEEHQAVRADLSRTVRSLVRSGAPFLQLSLNNKMEGIKTFRILRASLPSSNCGLNLQIGNSKADTITSSFTPSTMHDLTTTHYTEHQRTTYMFQRTQDDVALDTYSSDGQQVVERSLVDKQIDSTANDHVPRLVRNDGAATDAQQLSLTWTDAKGEPLPGLTQVTNYRTAQLHAYHNLVLTALHAEPPTQSTTTPFYVGMHSGGQVSGAVQRDDSSDSKPNGLITVRRYTTLIFDPSSLSRNTQGVSSSLSTERLKKAEPLTLVLRPQYETARVIVEFVGSTPASGGTEYKEGDYVTVTDVVPGIRGIGEDNTLKLYLTFSDPSPKHKNAVAEFGVTTARPLPIRWQHERHYQNGALLDVGPLHRVSMSLNDAGEEVQPPWRPSKDGPNTYCLRLDDSKVDVTVGGKAAPGQGGVIEITLNSAGNFHSAGLHVLQAGQGYHGGFRKPDETLIRVPAAMFDCDLQAIAPCRVVVNDVSSATIKAGASFDNVTLRAGDRVLLLACTDASTANNGVWVAGADAPARPVDYADGKSTLRLSVSVSEGTGAGKTFVASTAVDVGAAAPTFVDLSADEGKLQLQLGSTIAPDLVRDATYGRTVCEAAFASYSTLKSTWEGEKQYTDGVEVTRTLAEGQLVVVSESSVKAGVYTLGSGSTLTRAAPFETGEYVSGEVVFFKYAHEDLSYADRRLQVVNAQGSDIVGTHTIVFAPDNDGELLARSHASVAKAKGSSVRVATTPTFVSTYKWTAHRAAHASAPSSTPMVTTLEARHEKPFLVDNVLVQNGDLILVQSFNDNTPPSALAWHASNVAGKSSGVTVSRPARLNGVYRVVQTGVHDVPAATATSAATQFYTVLSDARMPGADGVDLHGSSATYGWHRIRVEEGDIHGDTLRVSDRKALLRVRPEVVHEPYDFTSADSATNLGYKGSRDFDESVFRRWVGRGNGDNGGGCWLIEPQYEAQAPSLLVAPRPYAEHPSGSIRFEEGDVVDLYRTRDDASNRSNPVLRGYRVSTVRDRLFDAVSPHSLDARSHVYLSTTSNGRKERALESLAGAGQSSHLLPRLTQMRRIDSTVEVRFLDSGIADGNTGASKRPLPSAHRVQEFDEGRVYASNDRTATIEDAQLDRADQETSIRSPICTVSKITENYAEKPSLHPWCLSIGFYR